MYTTQIVPKKHRIAGTLAAIGWALFIISLVLAVLFDYIVL